MTAARSVFPAARRSTARTAARATALAAALLAGLGAAACATTETPEPATGDGLLYVWAGDADERDADFLAVIDARPGSERYGRVLSTTMVEGKAHIPHHTEYEHRAGSELWANGWGSGTTFRFDLSTPDAPRVAGSFGERGDYRYPHSYARLPNGNVLATFQSSGEGYGARGGLVEIDTNGAFVRAASGVAPGVPADENWTYSLLVLPDIDRVVTTNTRMGLPAEWNAKPRAPTDATHEHASEEVESTHVLVWRLSDLTLLHTLRLPAADGHEKLTAEPRRLANGEVFVNTFSCGLYRIADLGGDAPRAELALTSPVQPPGWCAVPVVIGNLWIQPSATEHAIVAYDLSEPSRPREASRLAMPEGYSTPHWIAVDPARSRLVVTFSREAWVMLVNVDPATGALTIDEGFKDAGAARAGVNFDRADWPHGVGAGRANPHGAVFFAPTPNP